MRRWFSAKVCIRGKSAVYAGEEAHLVPRPSAFLITSGRAERGRQPGMAICRVLVKVVFLLPLVS